MPCFMEGSAIQPHKWRGGGMEARCGGGVALVWNSDRRRRHHGGLED